MPQLGETPIDFSSEAMNQFNSQKQTTSQPSYKNYNEKVNVITGQVEDRNFKQCGYERFTEKEQHLSSKNKSVLPTDLYVACPITGRPIVKK